jgi:glucokinase
MYLLAGDIGGTKCLMALARIDAETTPIYYEASLPSAGYASIEGMLLAFLEEAGITTDEIRATALAVAGPIDRDGDISRCHLTNLPWYADSEKLSAWLGHSPVELVNDFAAIGYSLDHLQTDDFISLQEGRPDPEAPQLAVGAGTGLGLCLVDGSGDRTRVHPSESGHVHFSPADAEQLELLRYWLDKQGHCSREFLLSGPGIPRIAEYLQQARGITAGAALIKAMREGDTSAALSRAALDRSDELAINTLRLFVKIYASQLSDLALSFLPGAGLNIAGGIAAKILPLFKEHGFMDVFRNNPTMAQVLEQIPVRLITTPRCGLIGALQRARQLTV